MDNCEFNYNEVKGTETPTKETWASGAAIFVEDKLILTNSNFTANKAEYNGGALYYQIAEKNDVVIDNCIFKDNFAGSFYGAVYLDSGKLGNLKLNNSKFINNTAKTGNDKAAGAFYFYGDRLTVDKPTLLIIVELRWCSKFQR